MSLIQKPLWAALGPIVATTRARLLAALDAHHNAVAIDLVACATFSLVAVLVWVCFLRSTSNAAWALLQILFFAILGLAATNVVLLIFQTAVFENPHIQALNATASFLYEHAGDYIPAMGAAE
jgi:hypothetical protein